LYAVAGSTGALSHVTAWVSSFGSVI